jgi:glucose/arabinose dehydrogenase
MNTLPKVHAGIWLLAALLMALPADDAAAQTSVALKRLIPQETVRRPVHLAEVPDEEGTLVVVEQDGRILRFRRDAPKADGVVLDHRQAVSRAGNEEGLLSVAFHPRFAGNRAFFIYYAAASPRRTIVSRFTYDPQRQAAMPGSERILLEVSQPYGNHKGGQLAFGPDGFLYVGVGDGGSGGDPHNNGQNRRTLLGKILRIDVDREQSPLRYAIPADNPLASEEGARAEIWAYGLRNPWRFSFDRETGALYAADVGQNAWEEVDRIEKGGNYGWNLLEGTHCYRASPCSATGTMLPIAEYGRAEGQSITGGFVYRGMAIPALRGRYVFGDFVSGTVWTIPAGQPGMQRHQQILASGHSISSFGEDAAGELYLLDLSGGIYQLVPGK